MLCLFDTPFPGGDVQLPVAPGRRALPHDLLGFVDLEPRLLQLLHDAIGELLARLVGHVILRSWRSRSQLRVTEKPIEKVRQSRKHR
jgi:hypothetical protein